MAVYSEVRDVGVVVERRKLDNPWQDHAWHSVAVLPGAPSAAPWQELARGDGWKHYYAGSLPLELHRSATTSYRDNLGNQKAKVFVVLRRDDSGERPYRLFLATLAPDEAQVYLESGDDIVDAVDMPADILAWVESFVEQHHVDAPVYKRQRKPHDPRKGGADPRESGPGQRRAGPAGAHGKP
jgi:Protein of unknown function (DUF3305)